MDPRISKYLRNALDNFIPLLIRDSRWFYWPIIKLWDRGMDPDFKVKAPYMQPAEIQEAYQKLRPVRKSDMTPATVAFVLSRLVGDSVLEVGCGDGSISLACAKKEFEVTATDLSPALIQKLQVLSENSSLNARIANVEDLPFSDNQFDTTLCLHTLEHVVHLQKAIRELKRVTRKRLIIIVPKQRYFRYTADYHLHFFASKEQLLLALDFSSYHIQYIDHCYCFSGECLPH